MLQYVLFIILGLLAIPVSVFSLQVLLAAYYKTRLLPSTVESMQRPSVAVIVPAHNEERGIAETLNAILPQLNAGDQLVVVADNCTDATASVAKSMGAIVLERFSETLRGKGYALDHGMRYLAPHPPEVVLIIDADCLIDADLVSTLSKQCMQLQRPIQANYRMTFAHATSLKQQVTELAWLVKNTVRPLGFKFLGLPCQLMGTGMAFLWTDLSACNLASGHLVEDMQLGLELAKKGKSPVFNIDTNVSSYFPSSDEGQSSQRARWEHGHLSIILNEVPKLLNSSIKAKNKLLFAQVLDLSVPPLALLFMLVVGAFAIACLDWLFFHHVISLVMAAVLVGLLGLSIMVAWAFFGRNIMSLKQLLLAPMVIFMKIPVYIGFVVSRQVDWVRSKRD